jgi:hypothetical protein
MGSVGISVATGVGTGMKRAKSDSKGDCGEGGSPIPVPNYHVPKNEQPSPYCPRLLAPSPLHATSTSRSPAASRQLGAEHAAGAGTGAAVGAVPSVSPVGTEGALHIESEESTSRKEEGLIEARESPHNRDPEVITCRDNMLRREKHELEANRREIRQSKGILVRSPTQPPPHSPGNSSISGSSSSSNSRVPLGAVQHFKKRGSMSPLQRCCDILCMVWPLVLVLSVGPGVGAGPTDQRGGDGGVGRTGEGSVALLSGADSLNQPQRMSSSSSSSSSDSSSRPPADPTMPVSGLAPPPPRRIRVTDGWWWCDAALDCELSKLLGKVLDLPRIFLLNFPFLLSAAPLVEHVASSVNRFLFGTNVTPLFALICTTITVITSVLFRCAVAVCVAPYRATCIYRHTDMTHTHIHTHTYSILSVQ